MLKFQYLIAGSIGVVLFACSAHSTRLIFANKLFPVYLHRLIAGLLQGDTPEVREETLYLVTTKTYAAHLPCMVAD